MRMIFIFLTAAAALAQQPRIGNAVMETRATSGNPAPAIQSVAGGNKGGAWVGYAVPVILRGHNSCCYHSTDEWSWRGCWLEGNRGITGPPPAASAGPVQLEGPSRVMVLFRVSAGVVERIRIFTSDCELDGGGLPFVWLTGVSPVESVSYLQTFLNVTEAADRDQRRLADGAMSALALHADSSATLEKLAQGGPAFLRDKALFWLGNAHGVRGFEFVSRIAQQDADDRIRERAIFALTQSKHPRALDTIISIARTDKSPRVRKQAMFWLGQSKDPRAFAFIEHLLAK